MMALILAAACVCPQPIDWRPIDAAITEAARKTDREVALRKLQAELDEIVRQTRAEFEKGHPLRALLEGK